MRSFLILLTINLSLAFSLLEARTSALLRDIEYSIDEKYRYPASIIEKNFSSNEHFSVLQDDIKSSWQDDLKNFNAVAPTDIAKVIYLKAAQGLPIGTYVSFLDNLATLVESKILKIEHFRWALTPSSKNLQRFWYRSRDNPEFRDLAERSLELFEGDSNMIAALNAVLEGELTSPGVGTGDYTERERKILLEKRNERTPPANHQRERKERRELIRDNFNESNNDKGVSDSSSAVWAFALIALSFCAFALWKVKSRT